MIDDLREKYATTGEAARTVGISRTQMYRLGKRWEKAARDWAQATQEQATPAPATSPLPPKPPVEMLVVGSGVHPNLLFERVGLRDYAAARRAKKLDRSLERAARNLKRIRYWREDDD